MKLYDMFMKLNDIVTSEAFKVSIPHPYVTVTTHYVFVGI